MTPGAHLLASWALANTVPLAPRERRLVTLAGVLPDLDGLGVIVDLLSRDQTALYDAYHHVLCHNLPFGVALSCLVGGLAISRRLATCGLAFLAYHLHLLCDLAGSKGPDGFQWPIPYLAPFSSHLQLTWQGQWSFNGWQNLVILALLLGWALWDAGRRRRSFIEVVSTRLDRAIFEAIAKRWPARSR
jgi:hypothetical protein